MGGSGCGIVVARYACSLAGGRWEIDRSIDRVMSYSYYVLAANGVASISCANGSVTQLLAQVLTHDHHGTAELAGAGHTCRSQLVHTLSSLSLLVHTPEGMDYGDETTSACMSRFCNFK